MAVCSSSHSIVFVATIGLRHRWFCTRTRLHFHHRRLSDSLIQFPRLTFSITHGGRAGARRYISGSLPEYEDADQASFVDHIVIPEEWTLPEAAAQESEWLRIKLHQWLDDEFCPEPANVEISKRCSKVYYYCLLEKQLDIGEILLQMIRDLETFSFKESFHGAFSSANAAIAIITKKVQTLNETNE